MRKGRTALRVFRVEQGLTQAQMAKRLGCSSSLYSLIEQGKRNGTIDFWKKVESTFNIPAEQMWKLTQVD